MTRRRYLSTWLQRRVAGEGPLSAVWGVFLFQMGKAVESSTRLGGFRALKTTTEAPYTSKVNYRE